VAQLAAALDQGAARMKGTLLATSLCWNDEHLALVAWLCDEHAQVFEMAMSVLAAKPAASGDEMLTLRLPAAALYHWGESLKWATRRERADYTPLHALMSEAMRQEVQRQPVRIVTDGRGRTVTLEALYFRALLLDRFGGGSLTRPQLEILDGWLWEWVPVLTGRREAPEGACLRVDLEANTALRDGADGGAQPLYLALQPLVLRRREVIAHLHRGRLVPEHGSAADMRIEEHVAVLEQVGRAFDSIARGGESRAERRPGAGQRIEVWVGLQEILSRGLAPRASDGATRVGEEVRAAIAASQAGQAAQVLASEDPTRRYLWLTDVSDSGFGFEALGSDAIGIDVGDILGWRRAPGEPCAIGRVARRMPGSSRGQVYFGVQVLTPAAQALALTELAGEREIDAEVHLYVPGDDDSGRRDAFLMSESRHRESALLRARVGDRSFLLRLNRVRQRGRGWVLAGFEVEIPANAPVKVEEVVPVPQFRLAPEEEDVIEDAFKREVGARLLV
jgi:hypothetical protein